MVLIDGEEILQFNWKEREPNANDENCLTIYKDGRWNDMRCSSDKFAFCQKGKNINDNFRAGRYFEKIIFKDQKHQFNNAQTWDQINDKDKKIK